MLLLLSGCSQVRTVEVKVIPDRMLLADCSIPEFTGSTNGDLVLYTLELQHELMECNLHKKALRNFYEYIILI